jgi:hypothetical protein
VNAVLVVSIVFGSSYAILRGLRDWRRDRYRTPLWEADVRRRQLDREITESRNVGWRQ